MRITSAEFVKSAVKPGHYPPPEFPEIAFAGRSNVGKSTLINVLVNRKRLVKTSKTPGRTQLINFFLVNRSLYLVDLPGYGYAGVPEAVKRSWGSMIETYLESREPLRGVVLILDVRRTPGAPELDFVEWMERRRIPRLLVLTKKDKLSNNRLVQQRREIARCLSVPPENLILFSGKTRSGRGSVWTAIESLVGSTDQPS